MRVKRYRAKNMPEAMALVKADLGPDAVILHSKMPSKLEALLGVPSLEVTAAADTDLRDFPRQTPAAASAIQDMQRELAAIKATLSDVANLRQEGQSTPGTFLDDRYQTLLSMGLTASLARQITRSVADELSYRALEDESVLDQHMWWHVRDRIPSSQPVRVEADHALVFFLVGPTGVGKTTTIAKLAAMFTYYRDVRVLMITTDTFRIAAIPQMMAFGEYLRIPVQVAHDPGQLAGLIEKNREHYDLILVDTPGRSQRDANKLTELEAYLTTVPDRTVLLVLSAVTRLEDMRSTVEAFDRMPVHGLIVSKIDETTSLGAVYSLACETGIPLSYMTTGQQVPEDIQVASADRFVDLMMGASVYQLGWQDSTVNPNDRI